VFWNEVFLILKRNKPDIANLDEAIRFLDKSELPEGKDNAKASLMAKGIISDEVYNELKKNHENVLKELPNDLSPATYKKNTRGVVFIGGGRFSWLAYLSLKYLRATGSELPVEIIMPTFKDYEQELDFCHNMLPTLGASCVVVPDVFGSEVMLNWSFQNYQFKALALMISSFQHTLLLDSDNLILQNPDKIFDSEVYKNYGMITWPDYWVRRITPKFYDIAGVKVNEKKRVRYNIYPLEVSDSSSLNEEEMKDVPYHDLEGTIPDLSTESGQIFINKATHGKTLLLSLYYNLYGPKLFYRLFSMGDQGEGDKDTFPAAAIVTKQKYYQVKSMIKTFGYFNAEHRFEGVALGQKDPLADYDYFTNKLFPSITKQNKNADLKTQIANIERIIAEPSEERNGIQVFTLHCNYPKFDLLDLMNKPDIYDKEKNHLKYDFYGDFSFKRSVIKDGEKTTIDVHFEQDMWKEIKTTLCDRNIKFAHYAKADMKEVCKFAEKQLEWITSTLKS